jgi:hypothetical protein
MEQDPLKRGAIIVAPAMALAIGGATLMAHQEEPTITTEPGYSSADLYADQHEMRDMRQQLLGAQEAAAARERAAQERAAARERASRSRRASELPHRSHRQVRLTKVAANLLQDVRDLGECESGSDPTTNTGNGYYGEFQFDLRTWRGNGYTKYASRPDLASESEQIAATVDLHSKRGWSPWPACARKLGLFTHHYVQQG